MPKRTDLESILIIGAGPIVIGQACEFDYSGAQACKALRQEGYRVVLVNSNPATIMTDPDMADVTYIEPITWQVLERIIEKERPSAILPTMGGQTALNCALDLHRHGVLDKYGVELIGARPEAIEKAEDRQKFKQAMESIGLGSARSAIAHSMDEAWEAQRDIGFPVIIRPSFTLGGTGGGIAYNAEEFETICKTGLELSPTNELLIEESLIGWKEFEMEVVRDREDNCIIVCSIENLDPMGVHTGDSITVAPAQTLTDKEYQLMRNASIAVLREIGVDTGGSNVQFAIHPETGRMIVIEMNPRVSRSSALASKATGFPIAKVAAKLAVGYTLDELKNEITGGATPASFEPAIDYVVVKIPRFAFEKFPQADNRLTTQMKSVGEVMAIGRTFQQALQKAMRGLEVGVDGLNQMTTDREVIEKELGEPGSERIWYVGDAFAQGFTIEEVHALTKIDPWFLAQVKEIVDIELQLDTMTLGDLDAETLRTLKEKGYSDRRLGYLLETTEHEIRKLRHSLGVRPVYKRVDTCAAEFATQTAYLYSTYEDECEAQPSDRKKIIVLGGGPNRIGQGIEFDYCCVHASFALREDGFETIMVNCNPETVSTDYDISDRLYFEPLTFEDVIEIYEAELAAGPVAGVIVQLGGQTPLSLAARLAKAGVPILGTSPEAIDAAEDREAFGTVLQRAGLPAPAHGTALSDEQARSVAQNIGYPVLVRPSYVLGGRGMEIVYDAQGLDDYLQRAGLEPGGVYGTGPLLIDRFLDDAIEIDVDALYDGSELFLGGVMEHIEEAGIHSGDSACVMPPMTLSDTEIARIRRSTEAIAKGVGVQGLLNIQFALVSDVLYVIEANPRASRTVPFVSKASGVQLAKAAALIMTGETIASLRRSGHLPEVDAAVTDPDDPIAVKEAVLPFKRFRTTEGRVVDTILGPEMRSTGEVMGYDVDFPRAFAKSQAGAYGGLPCEGTLFVSVADRDKRAIILPVARLAELGFTVLATTGTAQVLRRNGIDAIAVRKISQGVGDHGEQTIAELIECGAIDMVVNTPKGQGARADGYSIRAATTGADRPIITTVQQLQAAVQALEAQLRGPFQVRSLQEHIADRRSRRDPVSEPHPVAPVDDKETR